jgi:hypothetical protein
MLDKISFIEIEPEGDCWRCGRGKINENDKFYRVLWGDSHLDITVCELCKGGFSGFKLESPTKTYATHLLLYVRRSLLEVKDKVSKELFNELICSLENYETGNYSASFRSIGLVAERITNVLYAEKIEKLTDANKIRWEEKLGKLIDSARKTGDVPGEAAIYQLFSLKIFRNNADHPSTYQITAEDGRLGLASISYLIQWKLSKKNNNCYSKVNVS